MIELSEKKKSLIREIVQIEWEMFSEVKNIGGRAACQEDPETFRVMRVCQWMQLPEEVLESYLKDLKLAKDEGRNLMELKYARMQGLIPPLKDLETLHIIDEIARILVKWQEELYKKYPKLLSRGRPLYSYQDTEYVKSFETYIKAELETYSRRTLELYYKYLLDLKAKNINGSEAIYECMVKYYGYDSLEDAERSMQT